MPNERMLNRKEAAEILQVSPATIGVLTKKGILRPVFEGSRSRGKLLYPEGEVLAALESRGCAHLSISQLTEVAQQALATAQRALREIRSLENLIGLKAVNLPLNEECVRALHLEAQEALTRVLRGEDKVNYWAEAFMGMCDLYIQRMVEVLQLDNPWTIYLDLSARLKKLADFDALTYNPALKLAYMKLHFGRQNLRYAVITYIIRVYGKGKAKEMFPGDFGDLQQRLTTYATLD
jgi:hypothetical protein